MKSLAKKHRLGFRDINIEKRICEENKSHRTVKVREREGEEEEEEEEEYLINQDDEGSEKMWVWETLCVGSFCD